MGDDLDRVYYYTIFPSLLLSLHPDYAMVHSCKPLAADRTEVTCAWLFDPSAIARRPVMMTRGIPSSPGGRLPICV